MENYFDQSSTQPADNHSSCVPPVIKEGGNTTYSGIASLTEYGCVVDCPKSLVDGYSKVKKIRMILTAPDTKRFGEHGIISYVNLLVPSQSGIQHHAGQKKQEVNKDAYSAFRTTENPRPTQDIEQGLHQYGQQKIDQTIFQDVKHRVKIREFSIDAQVWESLMSNDPADIESIVNKLDESEKRCYLDRLLTLINQNQNDLMQRVAAGNAIGILGDPRIQVMEMIVIPAGDFIMGTDDGDDTSPKHDVYLDTYEIAKYPLTNIQYKVFLDANPQHKTPDGWKDRTFIPGKGNHPVVNISRSDALSYINWLNKNGGTTYRLPTEAEWEKAGKGINDERAYPWGNEFDSGKCNTRERRKVDMELDKMKIEKIRKIDTTPVGIYSDGSSPYGVIDMAGNVWEWCADWYAAEYYTNTERRNPDGPNGGEVCVVRGGSWRNDYDHARCVSRHWNGPNYWFDHVGVRLCRTP